MKRTVLKLAFSEPIYYNRKEAAQTALKGAPHRAFSGLSNLRYQDGALKGFNLEPLLLDELTDWEAQLKPFREEILDITGGGA